jgi:hypothetical protein
MQSVSHFVAENAKRKPRHSRLTVLIPMILKISQY